MKLRTDFVLAGIIRDISQRKRAEELRRRTNEELRLATEKAQQADRLKSAFLASMPRELCTSLNSIIGCSGMQKDEPRLCHARE